MRKPGEFASGKKVLKAPNNTIIEIDEINPPVVLPTTKHSFVVKKLADQAPWIIEELGCIIEI